MSTAHQDLSLVRDAMRTARPRPGRSRRLDTALTAGGLRRLRAGAAAVAPTAPAPIPAVPEPAEGAAPAGPT